jgi:parallel beta-helix repeat protein
MNIPTTSWARTCRVCLKGLLSIGLLSLILPVASATNYYVAANGSDTSAGTSPGSAWKTMARVNSRMNSYAAGDSILFHRGDVWRDTTLFITTAAATPAAKIVFGAYGTGADPIFMGSTVVTGWTQINGRPIWWAPYDKWAMNLYQNNKLLTVARYPNSGWLTATANGTQTTFTDTALGKPADYFKDARVHVHTQNFKWEYATVTAQTSGGSFTYSPATQYGHQKGFGYYLDGKYSLLDTTNEWFCDTVADRIYVYSDTNPSAALYEAPSVPRGVVFDYNRNNVVVQDLDLRQHADASIYMNYSTNCVVRNTAMRQANNFGLTNHTGSRDTLIGCTVEDINGNGIQIGARNSAILHNTVRRIALVPGYGRNAYADHGIITGPASYIAYNKIDSIANLGIDIDSGSVGEKNIINCACIVMNDCGGLSVPFGTAVYNNNQDTFKKGYNIMLRNNFVLNSVGGTFGTPPGNLRIAKGIYYGGKDDTAITSINNTVINCTIGISLLDTWYSSVIGNTVYNCGTGITNIVLEKTHPQNNNVIKRNVIYGIGGAQVPLSFANNNNTIMPNNFNLSDSNWLINPYSDIAFRTNIRTPSGWFPSISYTISRLWAERGHDLNSKGNFKLLTPFKSYTVASANYITNSTFTTNISGWGNNQNFAVPFVWDPSRAGMTGGSLKFGNQVNTYVQPLIQLANGFTNNSSASNWFCLKWDAIGNAPNYLKANVSLHYSPWSNMTPSQSYAIETTANTREYFFQLPAGPANYRAGFYIASETPNIYLNWLDNVQINQVSVVPDIAPELRSPLFTNMTDNVVNIPLNGLTYLDVDGRYVCGDQLTLQPWSSQVLMLVDEDTAKPVLTSASQPNLALPNVNECRWYHFDAGSNERAVSVHPQGNNLDSVTTSTYIAPGAVRSIGSRKVLGRNWVVTPSGTPGTPVKVRLYFSQAELDTLMVVAPSVTGVNSLVLNEYSGPNQDSSWANNIPSAANNIMVPVSFTAYQNGYYAEFETSSSSEFWLSEEPDTELQVNVNGDASFSQTVRIGARGQDHTTDLHIRRIGGNRLDFSWSRKEAIADLDVRVFNSIGQTVFREARSVAAGNDTVLVNLPELPQGIYILTLTGGGLQLSTKFNW